MVTAGVYLIARMHPLFELAPTAADVGAIIGCLTLLVAGTIAIAVTDLKRVIAYSTMSQIGYMIMAVSAGAYAAGLFHLMTHAFFKALLFMAAGSVIAAMAGQQNLDKMGGFKKAMPFTFGCMCIGGLALAGVPPFSGFFSKDEILLLIGDRGGWYWGLYVAGYAGAFLTGIYTFRMIFRAFYGEPVAEARELEEGHLHHAEVHTNPANGEVEDTDVGFPGPEHHIAEREPTMKLAMGGLAVLAVVGGFLQIPKILPASVFMILVVSGVSTLIHLYSISYIASDEGYVRFFAYLNFFVFSMLLLVLAGNFVLLIVGWAFVGAASYMLISFWYRRGTATKAGIKAFVINVLGDVGLVLGTFFIFKHVGTVDFLATFEKAPEVFENGDGDLTAGCILLLVGAFAKSAQIPLHTWLPDAMEGPTPVSALIHAGHDGHRRRLPHRPHAPALRARADGGRRRRDHRLPDAARRGHDRDRRHRPEARHRLLDDVADRLHDHGRQRGRLRRGPVSPHDARLLQGAAVHGRRLGDRRDGGPAEPRQDGRLQEGDAVHVRLHVHRRPGARRRPAVLGLLLQGRDPAAHRRPRRLVLGPLRRRLRGRVPDRDLHVPDDLPRLLRRAGAPRRASWRRATCTTPRSTRTPPTARSRTPTSASPAPSTTSPSASRR